MNSSQIRAGGNSRLAALNERTRVRERELLRVSGQLTGTDSAAAAQAARSEVLKWAAQQTGDQLPNVALEGRSFEHLRGGRTCIAAGFADDHRALWALRVDRPDAHVAQRTWTTEIVVGHVPGGATALFSLRCSQAALKPGSRLSPRFPAWCGRSLPPVGSSKTVCGLERPHGTSPRRMTLRSLSPPCSTPPVSCPIHGSSGDLRKPIDEGIHNERCGADSFEFGWGNRRVPVEWHLKNGGNTRDPRRCLRIYYFWDEESQMVVIATMPAHVRTGAT